MTDAATLEENPLAASSQPPPKTAKRKRLFLLFGGGLILIAACWWIWSTFIAADAESTENAYTNVEVRSEEHTSELQSLMRISYAVFCLKKKNYLRDIHI